jgi:hypothetical protein
MLLTGLAACGGDDSPPKAEPTRTASTPTTPSPTPPTLPAAAKANTKAGAKAFVRHYIETFNYAERTGDTAALRKLEAKGCESCKKVRKSIDQIYSSGGHVAGGRWIIQSLHPLRRPDQGWVVDALGRFAPSTVYPGTSAKPRHASGGKAPSSFFVSFDGGWHVTDWSRAV